MSKKMIKSTMIVAASTLTSRVLGFIRDMIIAKYFGASAKLDGFFVAFRIPNLFRRLVGEGAVTIAFVPVYTEYLELKSKKEALEFAYKIFTLLLLVLFFIVLGGIAASPYIVKAFAPGFTDQLLINLTVALNRCMFPYLFQIGFVAFAMGLLNSHRYFFAPAFSPVLLNVGFILGVIVFSKLFEEPIYGLAVGVLLGGLMQMILQLPYLIKSGFKFKISLDFKHPGVRKMFLMMIPVVFSAAVYQLNLLVNTIYASTLPKGSISYLYYSDRLTELVMGIFIISIGSVILPKMSSFNALKNSSQFNILYRKAVQSALFLAVPASLALVIIGLPIISVLFMRGEFSFMVVKKVSDALFFASMGIIPLAITRITLPAFFAKKDTLTPFVISLITFIVNAALGYFLKDTSLKHAGLALASAIAVTVQVFLILLFYKKKIDNSSQLICKIFLIKIVLSACIMGLVLYFLQYQISWKGASFLRRLFHLIIIILLGGGTYFLMCYILRVKEVLMIKEFIFKKINKRK